MKIVNPSVIVPFLTLKLNLKPSSYRVLFWFTYVIAPYFRDLDNNFHQTSVLLTIRGLLNIYHNL